MKEIKLTQGYVTQVDDEDYDFLNQFKWQVHKDHNNICYAVRSMRKNDIYTATKMHRLILGLTDPKIHGDHIDHNGLNNQRSNLRIATHGQNAQNRRSSKNSTSKYLGVHWDNHTRSIKKWKSKIRINNRDYFIGRYISESEAALAYNIKAKELFGEFANLNEIINE